MHLHFQLKSFDQLSNKELYQLLQLRVLVFVIEQNCPYQDLDDKDYDAWHLWSLDGDNRMVAYCRLLPPGVSYPEYASIGRVVTHPDFRGRELGRMLMKKALAQCAKYFPGVPVKISAQTYLLNFYTSLGFVSTGEAYLEDGIPHTAMILNT
jgi:ElaA protein